MRLQNIARAAGIMSGHRRALSNLTYFMAIIVVGARVSSHHLFKAGAEGITINVLCRC